MTPEELELLPKEFVLDTYDFNNAMFKSHVKNTLSYLEGKLKPGQKILDIGGRGPLTDKMELKFNVSIQSTTGDLDVNFEMPESDYDVVIYSHTIEHQFNPLYTLLKIKDALKPDGKLYILLPERGKLLWTKGHYHEIDEYRMRILLRRSGLKVVSKTRQKVWRKWHTYFHGIRPILRLFSEYHVIYCTQRADS